MFLNANIPHFYCWVRAEYLHDLQDHHGEFIPVCVFGIASIPSRAVMFHVMTAGGAQIARLPISALCWNKEAPPWRLEELELWDAFSYEVAITEYDFLRGLRVRCMLKDRHMYDGTYMFTIDWCGSPYSEDPGEGGHKCAHMLKLANGCYALQPNNRIFWHEPSFITEPLNGNPGYKTNSHVWSCENKGGKWHTSPDDSMFYELVTNKEEVATNTGPSSSTPAKRRVQK